MELLRAPSYGYDLIRRLSDHGFRRATGDPGVVYKVLRSLEDAGSILSEWSTQESGPARRYYRITDAGRDDLRHRVQQLRRNQERVDRLLVDYALLTGDAPDEEPAAASAPVLEPVLASSGRDENALTPTLSQRERG